MWFCVAEAIEDLPLANTPEVLGLHANAEIGYYTQAVHNMWSHLLDLQPQTGVVSITLNCFCKEMMKWFFAWDRDVSHATAHLRVPGTGSLCGLGLCHGPEEQGLDGKWSCCAPQCGSSSAPAQGQFETCKVSLDANASAAEGEGLLPKGESALKVLIEN